MSEKNKCKYEYEDGTEMDGIAVKDLMDGIEKGEIVIEGDTIYTVEDGNPEFGALKPQKFKPELPQTEEPKTTKKVIGKIMSAFSRVGRAGETFYYAIRRGGFFRWRAKGKIKDELHNKMDDYVNRNLSCILDTLQEAGYTAEDILNGLVGIDEIINVADSCTDRKLGLPPETISQIVTERARRRVEEPTEIEKIITGEEEE